MSNKSYLNACFENGLLHFWPEAVMPIKVFVAPLHWYQSTKNSQKSTYYELIQEGFAIWTKVTDGAIRFQFVPAQEAAQIRIKWRRVNRANIGYCTWFYQNMYLYAAHIEIGLSDGILFESLADTYKIKWTILHEIGHALGLLGHSDNQRDVMFPYHNDVYYPSDRDKRTIQEIYAYYQKGANKTISTPKQPTIITPDQVKKSRKTKCTNQDLLDQVHLLEQLNRSNLTLQTMLAQNKTLQSKQRQLNQPPQTKRIRYS